MPFPAIRPGQMGSFIALALCLALSACATVEPWERGRLAKPQMAAEPSVLQGTLRAHTHASREAGAADSTATGGGCGCY